MSDLHDRPAEASGDTVAGVPSVDDARAAVYARADLARAASRVLAQSQREVKDAGLLAAAQALRAHSAQILEANAADLATARANGTSTAMQDRMLLDSARVESLAAALEHLASLANPVGEIVRGQTLPNGLRLAQVRVPFGVVAAIYEARPNVTVDIAGLALKSGNAVLLRGGSAVSSTNTALLAAFQEGLQAAGLPADAVQSVDDFGRAGATALMAARGKVDVLIPRGGRELIQTVMDQAAVPVIETGEGNVHIFIDDSAPVERVIPIVLNAKTQRPSVCNTVETLLVHQNFTGLGELLSALAGAGVVLHADEAVQTQLPAGVAATLATEADWSTEYMDLQIAVKQVAGLDEALEHISKYSSGHTEAILSNDVEHTERFTAEVDSAVVVVNASTRFTDGSEFGFGAEVGISTQKLHARGPMGLAELTSTKWILRGNGHVRR